MLFDSQIHCFPALLQISCFGLGLSVGDDRSCQGETASHGHWGVPISRVLSLG
jgi:hypothetical protein